MPATSSSQLTKKKAKKKIMFKKVEKKMKKYQIEASLNVAFKLFSNFEKNLFYSC